MTKGQLRPFSYYIMVFEGKYFRYEPVVKGVFRTSCIQLSGRMQCQFCKGKCQKAGKQKKGAQKLYCKGCKKYQQSTYQYRACQGLTSPMISKLVCESVSVRGIARVMQIGINTVLRRIISLANGIAKPPIPQDQPAFEVDDLWTFIGRKENEYWLAYALNKATGRVVDFVIGKRTKATLKTLIDNLLLSGVNQIRTDRLTHYQRLIPKKIHRYGTYCTNHIERKNLTIRTHLSG
jgi:insertion element IS1 protein InsB